MKIKEEKINLLIEQVDQILDALDEKEKNTKNWLDKVHHDYKKSARNLVHYMALRDQDLRSIQKKLRNLGMSRFANAQGHVKASLLNTQFILKSLLNKRPKKSQKSGLTIKTSKRLLINHTKELLGYRSKGRRVRIMVTQPTQAAYDYQLVHDMVKNGMKEIFPKMWWYMNQSDEPLPQSPKPSLNGMCLTCTLSVKNSSA